MKAPPQFDWWEDYELLFDIDYDSQETKLFKSMGVPQRVLENWPDADMGYAWGTPQEPPDDAQRAAAATQEPKD